MRGASLQASPFIRQDRIPIFLTMKDMKNTKGPRTKLDAEFDPVEAQLPRQALLVGRLQ
jgi:hypothetical protein